VPADSKFLQRMDLRLEAKPTARKLKTDFDYPLFSFFSPPPEGFFGCGLEG
jgi:hypothetical protein